MNDQQKVNIVSRFRTFVRFRSFVANFSGFSLIEVLISLGVITASVLILAGSLGTVQLVRGVRYEAQAYRIAASQVEELRLTQFSALPSSGSISHPNLSALPAGSGSFTVSDFTGTSGELKQAEVTVNWEERGRVKQVQLMTLITETGFSKN